MFRLPLKAHAAFLFQAFLLPDHQRSEGSHDEKPEHTAGLYPAVLNSKKLCMLYFHIGNLED